MYLIHNIYGLYGYYFLNTKYFNFQCYSENVNQLSECQTACKNDMSCINECFLALSEKNDLCPCGKYCESNFIIKLSLILSTNLIICLGGCPCLDCENCWDCSVPTECSSKDEEKKVFSSNYNRRIEFFLYIC